MKITVKKQIEKESELEYKKVEKNINANLSVYMFTQKTYEIQNNEKILKEEKKSQGFIEDSKLINIDISEGIKGTDVRYILAKKEMVELQKNFGVHTVKMNQHLYKNMLGKYETMISKNIYNDIEDTGFELFKFLYDSKLESYILENNNGIKLVEPIFLDYVNAGLNNQIYHLDELVEELLKNKNVDFIVDNKILEYPLKESDYANIILDIPDYNKEENLTECILIKYKYEEEDIRKIENYKQTADNWSIASFVVNELLGCRKFLKNPKDNVDNVEEIVQNKRKFKR